MYIVCNVMLLTLTTHVPDAWLIHFIVYTNSPIIARITPTIAQAIPTIGATDVDNASSSAMAALTCITLQTS
jgi:hypothetical protein